MNRVYVIAGPTYIGNSFGFYGHAVPVNRWAIVRNDEYANGGYGPCSVDDKLYLSPESAAKALEKRTVNHEL